MSILSVSAYGIIQAKRPGIATVKVVSTFDSQNFDEVIVEVSIPSSMVMMQNFPVETVVGSHLNDASFFKCDAFNSLIKWKTASESFVIVNATSEMMMLNELRSVDSSPPCSQASIYTSSPSRTVLQATLAKEFHYFDKSLSESIDLIDLKATLSIGAYLPLSVRQYSDGNHHGPVNKLDVIRAASPADRAPGRLRVTLVTVANGQIIRVAAVGISKFGEAFFSQVGTEQFGDLQLDVSSCHLFDVVCRSLDEAEYTSMANVVSALHIVNNLVFLVLLQQSFHPVSLQRQSQDYDFIRQTIVVHSDWFGSILKFLYGSLPRPPDVLYVFSPQPTILMVVQVQDAAHNIF